MRRSRAARTRSPATFLAKKPTARMISSPVRIPVPGIWSRSGTNARTTPSTTGENRWSTFWKNQTRRATDTTSGTMTKRPVMKVFFRFFRTEVFYRKLRGGRRFPNGPRGRPGGRLGDEVLARKPDPAIETVLGPDGGRTDD